MPLHEFSWKNIELSKFTFFLVQMWVMRFNALAWIFMKKYWTFKVLFFLSSDVRFNALAWIFMKKYWTFKVHFFVSWDVRFNALGIFMKKYWTVKMWDSNFFSFLVLMWDSMHMHEFSWKNIELSKFTFFLVQMWVMRFNALAWIFMKKYWTFKVHFFS